MDSRAWVATRKGLFELRLGAGRWGIARHAFLGDPVSMLLPPDAGGRMPAALNLGHFGVKVHASDDAGASWQEVATPVYPEQPADADRKVPRRRAGRDDHVRPLAQRDQHESHQQAEEPELVPPRRIVDRVESVPRHLLPIRVADRDECDVAIREGGQCPKELHPVSAAGRDGEHLWLMCAGIRHG